MKSTFKRLFLMALMAAATVMISACDDDDDDGGTTTPPPTTVPPTSVPVPVPPGPSPIRLTANTPPATFAAMKLVVNVGRVTIAGAPVVHFSIADPDGNGVIGFGSTSKKSTDTVATYPNLAFALAKLVPAQNGAPSYWVNYIVINAPLNATTALAAQRPGTDNSGTLVDNGNGTYSYTFHRDITKVKEQIDGLTFSGNNKKEDLGDLSYQAGFVHRVTIQVSGNAPGTGTNTPSGVETKPGVPLKTAVDAIYDFVPTTGQPPSAADASREIVATAKCNECHRQLGGLPGDSEANSGAGFHGGSRNETRYCVVCHTDQRRFGRTEATYDPATRKLSGSTYVVDGRSHGNLPNLIHKTHMGHILQKTGYDYAGVKFNEVGYPQDVRNCTKCHDNSATSTAKTAQGDNWKSVPSRLSCGACHDGINFATGKGVTIAEAERGLVGSDGSGHKGGPTSDDAGCVGCHTASLIDTSHLPVTPPNPDNALAGGSNANTNSAWIASNPNRLPTGAIKVSYEISSVTVNATTGNPVMVFRMLQNGVVKPFNAPPPAGTTDAALSTLEMWDGFFGSPSVQYAFSVPQDPVSTASNALARTDFSTNPSGYLRSIWNGKAAGTLSAPDANGWYTVTLTGVKVPANAKMLTGGLGFSYNATSSPPLTQRDGLATKFATAPATPAAGTTLRPEMPNLQGGLVVIAPTVQKVATNFTGRRAIVEEARCNACHQELGTFTTDAFHGGQRNDATTCSWCHNPNRASSGWTADSTNFVHAIHAGNKRSTPYNWHAASAESSFAKIKYPGLLSDCETCHLPGTYDFRNSASADAVAGKQFRVEAHSTVADNFARSPDAPAGSYGSNFSINTGTGVATDGATTNLVTGPITTTCFACHDTQQARAHMTSNSGKIYQPRGTATGVFEECLVCHGPGRTADIKAVHTK